VTAVIVACGSPRAQVHQQPKTLAAVHASPAVNVVSSGSTRSSTVGTDRDAAARGLTAVTSIAVTAAPCVKSAPSDSSPGKIATQAPAGAVTTLKEGARVRIEGLQAAPEMNGRTGVVCGAISQESGRWTVQIDADGTRAACRGTFRAANLHVIPSHNFGTEWVDEEGRVWWKDVDFSRECAKGHALAPLGDCGGDGGGMRLMCRLCHCFCGRDSDEAASWLTCSVVVDCCGGYAVCCSCARSPSSAAAAVSAGSDDFCTLVSCNVE